MKRTPLKRKTALKRGGRLRRTRKRMLTAEKKAKAEFDRLVLAKYPRCLLAGAGGCAGRRDPHHVIPKKRLRNRLGLSKEQLLELLWDARNGVPLCRFHHELVTLGARKLKREELPVEVFAFAAEHQLWAALARELDGYADDVRLGLDGQD